MASLTQFIPKVGNGPVESTNSRHNIQGSMRTVTQQATVRERYLRYLGEA